jgi:hypothetical protein
MTQQTVNYDAVLATGSKQKMKRPPITFLYGEKKIGKTTFGAAAPKPAFLCGEDGAHAIADVRFPGEGQIAAWPELLNYTKALAYGKHDHQTIVADTIGPLCSLCLDHTVAASKAASWEKMGWGKEEDLVREWRVWLSLLEHCRNKRNMGIILLAHATQAGVQDSQLGEKYYVWQGDMQRSIWNFTSNWADIVLYVAKERALLGLGDDERARAMVKDTHWVYSTQTSEHYGFEAGVRGGYWLPPKFKLELSNPYKAFADAISDTPVAVRARILELGKSLPKGGDATVLNLLAWATPSSLGTLGDNMTALRALEVRMQEELAKHGQPRAAT